jgi:hypothetical protein
MTTPTKTVRRALASLRAPESVPAMITYAQGIVKALTGNPAFPTTAPTLATVTEALTKLQTAEIAALARTKGAVAVRNEKRAALVTLLQQLRGQIQTVADASPETTGSIIESAGIAVKKTPVRAKRTFTAKPGAVSGSVLLVTDAAERRAFYEWQYSADGGKTWVSAGTQGGRRAARSRGDGRARRGRPDECDAGGPAGLLPCKCGRFPALPPLPSPRSGP